MAGAVDLDQLFGRLEDLGVGTLSDEELSSFGAGAGRVAGLIVQGIADLDGDLRADASSGWRDAASGDASEATVVLFAKDRGFHSARKPSVAELLEFLATELQAMRLLAAAADTTAGASAAPASLLLAELRKLCKSLEVEAPADDADAVGAAAGCTEAIAALSSKLPDGRVAVKPLLAEGEVSVEAVARLREINAALCAEYGVRREMVLQRLDVTLQSFLWSEKVEGQSAAIMAPLQERRDALSRTPALITVDDALSAGREILLDQERKVTASSVAAAIKKVTIGAVPDRGGRANEMRPKARDMMPAWQRRSDSGGSRGGGGRGGGRGRGGSHSGDRKGGGTGGSDRQKGGGGGGGRGRGGGGRGRGRGRGRGKGKRR